MSDKDNIKGIRLLFSGGGTLGPVTPLIAIIEKIKKDRPQDEIFWISTKRGVENEFLKKLDIKIYPISCAKLRRYISIQNFFDIFKFIYSLFVSYFLLQKIKPNIVITAGGYVSVPIVIIAKLLKIKILVHQQDIQIGLANKIMSRFANIITVSFKEHINKFKNKNIIYTGNPCRFTEYEISKLNKQELLEKYNLKSDKPVLLIIGGSSGAESLNKSIYNSIEELAKYCQIIHVTGLDKGSALSSDDYMQIEFLKDEAIEFMYLADIIVSRAGLATLTELSSLGQCAIIVPIRGHQEINAEYFYEKNAVELANTLNIVQKIKNLLKDERRQNELRNNIKNIMPHNSTEKIIDKIYEFK